MTAIEIVTAHLISEVWMGLGGDPPERGHARAFYRNGDNRNAISLNDAKGCWYDHRDNVGGGVLALVQRVLGCDKREAVQWLADTAGLPLDNRPFSRAEQRKYAESRRRAEQLSRDVANWERGLELFFLKRESDAAIMTEWFLSNDIDPGDLLLNARRWLERLRRADAESLVRVFRDLPDSTKLGFVESGRGDREHGEAVTREIVEMIVKSRGPEPA